MCCVLPCLNQYREVIVLQKKKSLSLTQTVEVGLAFCKVEYMLFPGIRREEAGQKSEVSTKKDFMLMLTWRNLISFICEKWGPFNKQF